MAFWSKQQVLNTQTFCNYMFRSFYSQFKSPTATANMLFSIRFIMGMGYSHQGQDKVVKEVINDKDSLLALPLIICLGRCMHQKLSFFSPHFYTVGWVLILLSMPWRYQTVFHIPVYNLQYASIICIWKMIFQWYTEVFEIS